MRRRNSPSPEGHQRKKYAALDPESPPASPLFEETEEEVQSEAEAVASLRATSPAGRWAVAVASVAALCAAEAYCWRREAVALSELDASRAAKHARALAELGPRAIGSEANDVLGADYVADVARRIALQCDACEVDVDVQRSRRGVFEHAEFLGGFTSAYASVTNVVARLRGSGTAGDDQSGGSVLVNAHLDSFVGAPGGFDDLIGVGVGLEALKTLAAGPKLPRDVVFLFNGAEESHQLGAHAFATQHAWARDVGVVLNLESMGAGRRELVFQCNSEALARKVLAGLSVP